jgi:cobalamin synthase
MASDWDALLVDDAWDDRPYDPDDPAAFDDEPLDSLVMEARDRLNCIGLFAAAAVVFALALLVVQTRDPILDPTAGYIGALLLGLSAGLMATMLFWLVVFARHRRIAYRGDWARAIRRGGWVFLVTALFVVLRLNKVFSPEIGLFILALVVVAEATLSVER